MKKDNEEYISIIENYREFFRRPHGKSSLMYRSGLNKKDISNSVLPSKDCAKTLAIRKPNLLDLNLALMEEISNPDYDINQIRAILEMKANPNINLSSGDKLAKKAIICGQTDIIDLLLQYGLDLDTPITGRSSKHNAVQLAKQWKRIEILELFEQHKAGQNKSEYMISKHVDISQNELFEQSIDLQNLSLAAENPLTSD